MTLGEIIKQYREEHGLSMDSFSKRSGISKAYISLLEKNRHPKTGKPIAPSIQSIKQAADGMGIDFNTLFNLLDGDVELSINSPSLPPYENIRPIKKQKLPVLGDIAAGKPILMQEEKEVYVETEIKADFILIVKGDSMIGARINDGDIVFVRQQPVVNNGEIAVISIDDEATLKRFYKYGEDLIVLRAENPAYKDMEFRPEDGKEIHVIGKAVAFQSDIK